ncbi:MAG TPA: CocE/NonD family hydrolase, partial [Thermoanaerobaculia bacterium]|nr:CocE/NonD family hydrolase [Thermoanaerobaculia bacterium]
EEVVVTVNERFVGLRLVVTWAVLAAALGALPSSAAEDSAERVLEVMVPMRDGVRLATTVFLPEGEGPFPAVAARTPYGRKSGAGAASADRYTQAGYAYVTQDQRGRFDSEGEYRPHEWELDDGYDTVEWVAGQPWSDAKVGLTGASALGIAANLAAAAAPSHLVAAYVVVAPQSLFYEGRFIGGVFKEADTGNWMRRQGVSEAEVTGYRKRVVLDQRWEASDLVFHRHRIQIPIYNVGGWYDLFSSGNVGNFRYLQEWGREGARGNQKLLMGPFGHGQLQGDLEYPETGGRRGPDGEEIRWFDYWLKGIDNGIMDEPPVTYYQMAAARKGSPSALNGYRTAETWPPSDARTVRLYLREGRRLSTRAPSSPDESASSTAAAPTAPTAETAAGATTYSFDPANPVPTIGGPNLTLPIGPMDQRAIPERDDYLRFSTEPLTSDLTLAGKLDVELWVTSGAPDTDFMVKLVDVYPDGYEALVVDTAQRARYRSGRRAEDVAPLEPGEPALLRIDLWHTAITIEQGHRLALHVTSSNHPRFEVNPNTGEAPGEKTLPPRVARNTILHDASHPSALLLPVMESPAPAGP